MVRRRIHWLGDSAARIGSFPEDARRKLGTALQAAQDRKTHASAKLMKGKLREVTEIVAPCEDGTYRLMYVVNLGEVIYVLHAFKKKSHSGSATPKGEIELIAVRLAVARSISRRR